MSQYPRSRSRNYGELSRGNPTPSRPRGALNLSRSRSNSPHRHSPTPLSHHSNPARTRSPSTRQRTPSLVPDDDRSHQIQQTAVQPFANTTTTSAAAAAAATDDNDDEGSQRHSYDGQGALRTVSGSSIGSLASNQTLQLNTNPDFPANLQKARQRVVSSSSTTSSDSDPTIESYLITPTVYKPGLSPLEICLPIYPIIRSVLSYLSTIDILTLYCVSSSFKAHLESTYSNHWSDICLCNEKHWIGEVYTPRVVEERVELDLTYKNVREYVLWKISEEQKALKNVRCQYDHEVAFMVGMELHLASSFASGGDRSSYERSQELARIQPNLFGGGKFAHAEIAARIETTCPQVFFNAMIGGRYILKVMLQAQQQLQYKTINPNAGHSMQYIKTLIIDGCNLDIDELMIILNFCPNAPQLEGFSARACNNLSLIDWAKYVGNKTRAFEKLKWLKIHPNEQFPLSPFHHDATKSLILKYRRPNIAHHPDEPPVFPAKLTLKEHLTITMPLLISNSPTDNVLGAPDTFKRRCRKLGEFREEFHRLYVRQHTDYGFWLRGPYISHLHPALKILALCKVRGIEINFNLCGSGSVCFGWKMVTLRRIEDEVAADEDPRLNRLIRTTDPESLGTHVIGSCIRGEKQGSQKCASCEGWEWDGKSCRRPGWLIDALGLGNKESWTVGEDGWVSWSDPLQKGVRIRLAMSFESGVSLNERDEQIGFQQEEQRCADLMREVGGVKIPFLIKKTEKCAVDSDGRIVKVLGTITECFEWPAGCGAGGVCNDCEANMTCWGCGKFYCQLCLFIPDVNLQLPTATPEHLIVLCPQGKHGPLCSDCRPKLNTTCDECQGTFCNICFPGGIKLEDRRFNKNSDRTGNEAEEQSLWEEWDLTDENGNADNGIGRDEARPPSEPEDWEIDPSEILETDAKREAEMVTWGGPGEKFEMSLGDVVKQLTQLRGTAGCAISDLEIKDVCAAELPIDYYDDMRSENENEEWGSDVDWPPEDGEYLSTQEDEEKGDRDDEQSDDDVTELSAPDVRCLPTLVSYSATPAHFPSYQSQIIKQLLLKNPPKDLDCDLTTNEPIQMYTTCTFCETTTCAVCAQGRVNKFSHSWNWDRCSGCGGMMCPECCHRECQICQRGLCKTCYIRESEQIPPDSIPKILPHVRNIYSGTQGQDIYFCLRCTLRRGIYLNKFRAEIRNPNILPTDGYGQEMRTNGLVDPRMGYEAVKQEFRQQYDINGGALVGVFNQMRGSVENMLSGTGGEGGKIELGMLCEEVAPEFEEGDVGAMSREFWEMQGEDLLKKWVEGDQTEQLPQARLEMEFW